MNTLQKELLEKINYLYEEYALNNSEAEIPTEIKNDIVIRRRLESFDIYKEYLEGKSRFLDWGCRNALISYIIQTYLSDRVDELEIHGCDIIRGKCQIFSEKANLIYSQLNHHCNLPYEENYFDVVIGNGVLEHVANDYESLKELYRIIKNNGYLIITFLPNRLSYTEFLSKTLRNVGHRRKYSISEIKAMLLHSGFVPIKWGYHQVFPSLVSFSSGFTYSFKDVKKVNYLPAIMSKIYKLDKYAENLWPINIFSANIFVVAQRKRKI